MSSLHFVWQIFFFYGVISLGMSAALVPILSTIARWFKGQRGLMSGIVMSGAGLALTTIVPLSHILLDHFGWRLAYLIMGSVTTVTILGAAQFLRRDPGFTNTYSDDCYQADNLPIQHTKQDFTLQKAIRNYKLWLIASIYFVVFFLYFLVLAHLIVYVLGLGLSISEGILLVSFIGITSILGRIIVGFIFDKAGMLTALLVSGGLLFTALGCVLFSSHYWLICLFALIFGFSIGGFSTLESVLVAQFFGLQAHGAIFGMVFLCDSAGSTFGPVFGGLIYEFFGNYDLCFQIGLLLAGINMLLILILLLFHRPRRILNVTINNVRR